MMEQFVVKIHNEFFDSENYLIALELPENYLAALLCAWFPPPSWTTWTQLFKQPCILESLSRVKVRH